MKINWIQEIAETLLIIVIVTSYYWLGKIATAILTVLIVGGLLL